LTEPAAETESAYLTVPPAEVDRLLDHAVVLELVLDAVVRPSS